MIWKNQSILLVISTKETRSWSLKFEVWKINSVWLENYGSRGINIDSYVELLDNQTLLLINEFYSKDFEYFGYEMIKPQIAN